MRRALQILISSLALVGCAEMQTYNPQLQSDWDRTLSNARGDVAAGNYFAAGRLLDEFVRMHPGTPEAREIEFWKAAYLIDPANEQGSLDAGIAALDAYLATDSSGAYREQAVVLRRTAVVAKGLANQAKPVGTDSSTATVVTDTVVVQSKSRDEQIASLKDQLAKSKDELAKANAELERIKKRLANPSN
jgi:hypothetical protein